MIDTDFNLCLVFSGIPGSGKSSLAKHLALSLAGDYGTEWEEPNDGSGLIGIRSYDWGDNWFVRIHSTDAYFYSNGIYNFDETKLGYFHQKNFESFKESLKQNIPYVFVDNTNLTSKEYKRYELAAQIANYRVALVKLPKPSLDEAIARNKHNVPKEVLERMTKNFNEE